MRLIDWPIVDRVFAWKDRPDTSKFVPEAEDDPWRLLAWPATREDLTAFAAELSRDNPDSYLVQISCSYGGDAALICGDISVFDIS